MGKRAESDGEQPLTSRLPSHHLSLVWVDVSPLQPRLDTKTDAGSRADKAIAPQL
jgi:hypothetical protein